MLPTDICICCTRNSRRTIQKTLRNPKNPFTWFGKTTSLEIGLCKIHGDAYFVALSLTYSLFIMGAVLLVVGLFSLSLTTIVVATIFLSICGLFRARLPITSPNPKSELVEVRGAGPVMLSRLPVVDPVELDFS